MWCPVHRLHVRVCGGGGVIGMHRLSHRKPDVALTMKPADPAGHLAASASWPTECGFPLQIPQTVMPATPAQPSRTDFEPRSWSGRESRSRWSQSPWNPESRSNYRWSSGLAWPEVGRPPCSNSCWTTLARRWAPGHSVESVQSRHCRGIAALATPMASRKRTMKTKKKIDAELNRDRPNRCPIRKQRMAR